MSLTGASTLELYKTSLFYHTNVVISCDGTGTTYAALLDVDLRPTDGLFSWDPNCVSFIASKSKTKQSVATGSKSLRPGALRIVIFSFRRLRDLRHSSLSSALVQVLFLYQINNNGSTSFGNELNAMLSETNDNNAAVNVVHWSYPCRQGEWSSDGIEHGDSGDYLDDNGRTIDYNDP